MSNRQITLTVNDQTLRAIDELKEDLDVASTAAAIRRALALTRVILKNVDEDHAVTIIGKNGDQQKIILAG